MASNDDQPGDWPAPTPCAAIRGLWALGIPDMVYRMCTLPHHATRRWPSSIGVRSQPGRLSAVSHWLEVGVLAVPERDLPVRDGDALFEEAFGQFPADFCLAVPLATASDWTLLPVPVSLSIGGMIIPPEPLAGLGSGELLYRTCLTRYCVPQDSNSPGRPSWRSYRRGLAAPCRSKVFLVVTPL